MRKQKSSKLTFKPQKVLGQNFLTSPLYLTRIANAAQLTRSTDVVEIGAGYGSLTHHILAAQPRAIISIEKDPNLFSWLSSNLSFPRKAVSFLLADTLEITWEELLSTSLGLHQKATVVGNLPYNIANQLVSKLVRKQHLFQRLVFLVQKEVAQRWVASQLSYKSKYSSLSIMLNYFCKTELLFNVPKHSFKPQPPVDGAVVSLEFREGLPADFPTESFFIFTRSCFRFRRKTLLNNLKSFQGSRQSLIEENLAKLNLSGRTRPQDLSIEQYLKLFRISRGFSSKNENGRKLPGSQKVFK